MMKSTVGEIFVALVIAGVAATFAAILGAVATIFFCTKLPGEASESGLIAPLVGLVIGIVVFVLVFWRIKEYGESTNNRFR